MAGLKVWTGTRAMRDLVTRRISSSLLPENIGPQMTSIHPDCGLRYIQSSVVTDHMPDRGHGEWLAQWLWTASLMTSPKAT